MKNLLLIIYFATCSFVVFSQSTNDTTYNNGSYIDISGGLTIGSLRDMSTSPLFYTGVLPTIEIKYSNLFNKNLITFNFNTSNGLYLTSSENDFYNGSGNIFDFELSYFRNYDEFTNNSFGNWPGLSINNSTALRTNNYFGNAAFTFDNISSININYLITKKWTRKSKEKKILWLIKYRRKEKKYLLSFKTGIPIYSFIYRPGFTNPGNATQPELLLPGYKMYGKVFSGMNTNISLARILFNGNMIKLSYNWDFFTSGKYSLNRLDTSKHTLLFSLVFKIK